MPLDRKTHVDLGLDNPTPAEVNKRSNKDALTGINHPDDRVYNPCAEAFPSNGVANGRFVKHREWRASQIYPDTTRSIGVYLPPTVSDAPLRVICFNDGSAYSSLDGAVRATRVLDHLHEQNECAPTAAVFIDPGRCEGALPPTPNQSYDEAAVQRSWEYDRLTPDYGRFLIEEVLPWVEKTHEVRFSDDPEHRTVCGISSGGICAFSCAWFHPDSFRRVISHCGSFTNIWGGHNYPYLVHTTPRKPLRVFLQSGTNDITTLFGHWPTANQAMARALDYAGYEHRFEFGQGGHTLRHGGALFADTLRWLWRAEPKNSSSADA